MQHRSWFMELSPEDFRPKAFAEAGIAIVRAAEAGAVRARHLWVEVGRGYWTERQRWSEARWAEHLRRDDVAFHIAVLGDDDLGFFELLRRRRDVKIEGFGLLPSQRGNGRGGALLSAATQAAFSLGAPKLRLHTASDDHPNALPNYRARGYRVYRETVLKNPMPG